MFWGYRESKTVEYLWQVATSPCRLVRRTLSRFGF